MKPASLLSQLETLAHAESTLDVIDWIDDFLLPYTTAKGAILAWGRTQPDIILSPIYSTKGALLGFAEKFRTQDTLETVPLLQKWLEEECPQIMPMNQVPQTYQSAWYRSFQGAFIEKVAVSCCYGTRAKYISYLCLIDPTLDDSELSALLSAVMPILHSRVGYIKRKKRTRQKQENALLTERESEILHWVKQGKTNLEISAILGVSFPTIKNHLQKIMVKLRVNNRAEAVARTFARDVEDTSFMDTTFNFNPKTIKR